MLSPLNQALHKPCVYVCIYVIIHNYVRIHVFMCVQILWIHFMQKYVHKYVYANISTLTYLQCIS